MAIPNDEHWDRLWGMRQINAPQAWDIEKGGAFVTVAVLDTGVAPHPDLVDRLLDGYDTVDDDNDASPEHDPNYPDDISSHGTHCAGTVAAQGDNGIGVVGVCWDSVKILPVRVLGADGSGSTDMIVDGLDYALQMDADVVSMSLGRSAGYPDPVEHAKIAELHAWGIIIVAAAGNDSAGVGTPAAYPECIAVSSIGPTDTLAFYSNFGPEIDIAAPGGDMFDTSLGEVAWIWSTVCSWPDNTLTYGYAGENWQGTSMACPHVAGAAALLLSAGVPASEVRNRLTESARPPRTGGFDPLKYGAGILDVGAALANASVRIVKPDKGSTVGTNPQFKIVMRGIQENSPKVYFDYADDGDGMPDNLTQETPIIDSSNLSLYANAQRTEITFSWRQLTGSTLAPGRHYIYVEADPLLGGGDVFDWATFVAAEVVIPRGLRMFSVPYVMANTWTTSPSGILIGTDFSIANPNRSVLKRYITMLGEYATYYPGNVSDLVWVNPVFGGVPTGGAYFDAVLIDPATQIVLDRKRDQFAFPVGAGFWLILDKDAPLDAGQVTLDKLVLPGGYVFDASEGCEIPLYQGWNMVGNPYTHKVPLAGVLITYQGTTKTLADAAAGLDPWVSAHVYGYSSTGVVGYLEVGPWDVLEPYKAYWVRALKGGSSPTDQVFIKILPQIGQ